MYGARPLRRYIAHEVETRIARALLRGAVPDGATIRLDLGEGGELVVSHEAPAGRRHDRRWRLQRRTVVTCPHCGKRNRVPSVADGVPRCGNCRHPLPWIAEAGDDDFAAVAERAPIPCWWISGRPGAVRAAWSAPRWNSWPPNGPA